MRISYVDVGNGPVVVLLHGLAHSIHGWRKNIGPISAAGYRVMAIDLPGFGYSDVPPDFTLETYRAVLREWLDLHCVDRAVVVGNSMGGLISASFAGVHSDRVSAAVLVDPAGFGREMAWLLRLAGTGLGRLLTPRTLRPRQVRRGLRFVYFDSGLIEDEEVERVIELLSRPEARRAAMRIGRRAASLRGFRPGMGLGDLPEVIPVPTLILWGDHDRVIPVSHLERVQAVARDAEVTIVERCGHCPMMEVPGAFNQRVVRFLREQGIEEVPVSTG